MEESKAEVGGCLSLRVSDCFCSHQGGVGDAEQIYGISAVVEVPAEAVNQEPRDR